MHIIPRAFTADAFSSKWFKSTSTPSIDPSSLSESKENPFLLSFYFFYSTNSFSELTVFNISVITWSNMGAISSLIKIDKSAKKVKAVSRSSNFESVYCFKQVNPNYVNISIAY